MNENRIREESQKLIEAAMTLKDLLSNHKNAFAFETYFGDDKPLKKGGKTIDYRIKFNVEQVVFNETKTKVKHTVPPRLKNHIN